MGRAEFDFSKLSIAERIQLAEDLWDSIPPDGADVPLTAAQQAELDKRLEELEHDPDSGEAWETVRARLHDRQVLPEPARTRGAAAFPRKRARPRARLLG